MFGNFFKQKNSSSSIEPSVWSRKTFPNQCSILWLGSTSTSSIIINQGDANQQPHSINVFAPHHDSTTPHETNNFHFVSISRFLYDQFQQTRLHRCRCNVQFLCSRAFLPDLVLFYNVIIILSGYTLIPFDPFALII